MGLWSKGLERAQSGEIRLDEIYIPDDLLRHVKGNIYTVNTGVLVKRYKDDLPKDRLDMSKPQLIWWVKFEDRHLSALNFAITDPLNEIYMMGGTIMSFFEISDYNTNIITERENVKSNFIDTIRNIGRTGGYHARTLDKKEFSNLKHIVRYMCKYIKPKPYCETLFYDWLKK